MTSPKMHDPLFHFETHFPERLSRLHLNPEFCPQVPSRASRRSRAQRKCGRYKTQPITFDEITEVDEENVQDEPNEDNIKQLQEFSRSMDGLVIKTAKNSRRHHAKCDLSIPEDRNNNKRQESVQARLQTESLKDNKENHPKMKNNNSEPIGLPPTGLSPARDPRRQRITAKAKRRQMMDELQKTTIKKHSFGCSFIGYMLILWINIIFIHILCVCVRCQQSFKCCFRLVRNMISKCIVMLIVTCHK